MQDAGLVVLPELPVPALAGMRTRSRQFAAQPSSAREARRWVRQTLEEWALPSYVESAVLVTSELVTNVVLHTLSPLSLSLSALGGWVLLAVADGSPSLPGGRIPREGLTTTGRGLLLLQQLSVECGVERTSEGKQVWAVLTSDGQPA